MRLTALLLAALLAAPGWGATINVKAGDRRPAITWVALDSAGKRVDLTGATATFRMREPISGCTIVGAASIPSTKTGNLRYDWALGDTDFAGTYEGEFLVTFPDLTTWTFPTVGSIPIEVWRAAADPTPNNPTIYCQGSQPIPIQYPVSGDPETGIIPQGLHVYRYRGIGYQDMKQLYLGIIGPGAWGISTSGQPSALHPLGDNDRDVGKVGYRPRDVYAAGSVLVGTSSIPITSGLGAPSAACTAGSLYLRTDGGVGSTLYICEGNTWTAK